MSLLDIARDASDLLTLPRITQVIGNVNKNERQMLQIILEGGDDLAVMSNSNGGSWSVLERIHEFPTTAGTTEYDLPEDFGKVIVDTAWQKDKYWHMRGSLASNEWQQIRNRQASISYNVFRFLRTQAPPQAPVSQSSAENTLRKFTLEPAPGEGITLIYEYVSDYWWIGTDGTFKRKPTADDDESLFDHRLHVLDAVWRFKAANSRNFATDIAKFESRRDRLLVQDEAQMPIPIGYDRRLYANYTESDLEWCP